jgi:hypothetical protein
MWSTSGHTVYRILHLQTTRSVAHQSEKRAAAAERTYLLEMDRLMTSIRSLEGRLLLLHPEGLTVRSSRISA